MTLETVRASRSAGALVGLAVGDALGTTLEFSPRRESGNYHTEMTGGGPFRLAPGEWTDDTSMALALADSLIDNRGVLVRPDVLRRFSDWYREGRYSHNKRCFDIGNQTRSSIQAFESIGSTVNGTDEEAKGNGGLMRLAPAVMVASSLQEAVGNARGQSSLTHGSPECLACAETLGMILYLTIQTGELPNLGEVEAARLISRDHVSSSGRARNSLDAALWAVGTTTSFRDAVVEAVNLGDDADTVGAIAGQIAGALYGLDNIPEDWALDIAWSTDILTMAYKLYALRLVPRE